MLPLSPRRSLPFVLGIVLVIGTAGFSLGATMAYEAETPADTDFNESEWEMAKDPDFNESASEPPVPSLQNQEWLPEELQNERDHGPPPAWLQSFVRTTLVASFKWAEVVAAFVYANQWWFVPELSRLIGFFGVFSAMAAMLYPVASQYQELFGVIR